MFCIDRAASLYSLANGGGLSFLAGVILASCVFVALALSDKRPRR